MSFRKALTFPTALQPRNEKWETPQIIRSHEFSKTPIIESSGNCNSLSGNPMNGNRIPSTFRVIRPHSQPQPLTSKSSVPNPERAGKEVSPLVGENRSIARAAQIKLLRFGAYLMILAAFVDLVRPWITSIFPKLGFDLAPQVQLEVEPKPRFTPLQFIEKQFCTGAQVSRFCPQQDSKQ